MSRQVNVSDHVYQKLKELKGSKSFSKFIEERIDKTAKLDTIVSHDIDIANLKAKVDKIETFLYEKSGGQYA